MVYQKTWFSYILWVLYAGTCMMLLAFIGYYAGIYCIQTSGVPAAAGALVLLALVAALYYGMRSISLAVRKKYTMQLHTARMWECFIAAFVLLMSVLYQAGQTLLYIGALDEKTQELLCSSSFFQRAMITSSQQAEMSVYAGGWLYERCLSVVLSFLGNKASSALFLQLVLYVLILIFGYLAVRRSTGKVPACTVLISLALAMGSMTEDITLDPGALLFVLYLTGLLAVVCYAAFAAGRAKAALPVLVTGVLCGIWVGILCFFHAEALTLLLFVCGIGTVRRASGAQRELTFPMKDRLLCILFPILGAVAGFLATAFVYFGQMGCRPAEGFLLWQRAYLQGSMFRPFAFDDWNSADTLLYTAGLVVLASFLVFEFYRSRKSLNFTIWMLAGLTAAVTPFAGNGACPCRLTALFFWSVFAGLGLQNCLFGEAGEVMVAVLREINETTELPAAEASGQMTYAQTGRKVTEKALAEPEQTPPQEQPKKPRFIENPLPLPKKHVHREMDYQYPVEEKDMKYDVDVPENDDFDLS